MSSAESSSARRLGGGSLIGRAAASVIGASPVVAGGMIWPQNTQATTPGWLLFRQAGHAGPTAGMIAVGATAWSIAVPAGRVTSRRLASRVISGPSRWRHEGACPDRRP